MGDADSSAFPKAGLSGAQQLTESCSSWFGQEYSRRDLSQKWRQLNPCCELDGENQGLSIVG